VEFVGRHLLDPVHSTDNDSITRKINKQLHRSSVTLVLIETHTTQSDRVAKEIRWSADKGNGILGINLKGHADAPVPNRCRTAGPRSSTGTRMSSPTRSSGPHGQPDEPPHSPAPARHREAPAPADPRVMGGVVGVDQPAAAQHPATPMIAERELPALYRAADQNSLTGQRRYLTATGLRLTMLVAAATFGLFTWRTGDADAAGLAAAVAFSVALLSELYLLRERPDRVWYDGRAAAESAKTLTWRYLVGGDPFGKANQSDRDAEQLLLDRFAQIAQDLRGVHLAPVSGGADQLSDAIHQHRALPLDARRELYRRGRIRDQQDWYARKARWNEQRATRWSLALAALELVGLVGAVLKATGTVQVDLLGLAGAVVAAGVAWVQAKQHQTLASAYAVASQELATIGARINQPSTEQDWAHFVDQAEGAISREHTLWRASHS
jgi:hypothetical protein